MTSSTTVRPLNGLRIVELSSFVASPLCGLTLAQLGAEVIRVDPIGGAADVHRWPLADASADADEPASIYWTGLNKGKRSVTADLRSEEGQDFVRRLVTESGPGGGILVTNAGGRDWMSHARLVGLRPDAITLELVGGSDGRAAVDYTVNAGLGFPFLTGPDDHAGTVNHVLPAWDVICGIYAALAVTAAVRHREQTGCGSAIRLPLEDTALSIASTLGYLTEPQVNATSRQRIGNDVYGTYGTDFATADGRRIMIVALTTRHFRALTAVTETDESVGALEAALGADFTTESDRYTHRRVLSALFAPWFESRPAAVAMDALAQSPVLAEVYRTFEDVVADGRLNGNAMFAELDQPGIGRFLAAAAPPSFNGRHLGVGPAEALGASTDVYRRT